MPRICDLIVGKKVGVGHNVSHSNRKTKRKFVPNFINVRLQSAGLRKKIGLRIANRTLRTIDLRGNLDNFLLQTKNNKLTPLARKMKRCLIKNLSQHTNPPVSE